MPVLATHPNGETVTWMDFRGTALVLCSFGLIGIACVIAQSEVVVTVALMMAFAAAAVGIVLGFLMGTPPLFTDATGGTKKGDGNTHLEQISDWLTKVLVGAGLVQLGKVPDALQSVATAVQARDGLKSATITCILVSFFVLGFFIGYLATRLFLAGAFVRAARDEDGPIPPGALPGVVGAVAGAQAGGMVGALTGADAGARTGVVAGAIAGEAAGTEAGAAAGAQVVADALATGAVNLGTAIDVATSTRTEIDLKPSLEKSLVADDPTQPEAQPEKDIKP